jgi:Caspase domain/WG containing repeat
MKKFKQCFCLLAFLGAQWAQAQELEWAIKPSHQYYPSPIKGAVFKNGLCIIQDINEHKQGVIDKNGKIVVPIIHAKVLLSDDGIFLKSDSIQKGDGIGIWGFMDKNLQEIIPCNTYNFGSLNFEAELLPIRKKDNLWGFIDKKGKIVIPFKYPNQTGFHKGFCGVKSEDGHWGIIDKMGNEILSLSSEPKFHEDLIIAESKSGCKLMDISGKEIVNEKKYNRIEPSGNMFRVQNQSNLYGIIDKTGKEIIPLVYKSISYANEGLYWAVSNTNNSVLIDSIGQIVLSSSHYYDRRGFHNGFAQVYDEKYDNYGAWIYINNKGKEIYKQRSSYYGDIARYKLDFLETGITFLPQGYGRWAAINGDGKTLINGCEDISIQDELLLACIETDKNKMVRDGRHKWLFIDKKGKKVAQFKYHYIKPAGEGLYFIEINEKMGLMDKTGKELIPPNLKSQSREVFSEGLAWVQTEEGWGVIKNPLLKPAVVVPTVASVASAPTVSAVTFTWHTPRESDVLSKPLLVHHPELSLDLDVQSTTPLSESDLQIWVNDRLYAPKFDETTLQNQPVLQKGSYYTWKPRLTWVQAGVYKVQAKAIRMGQLLGESKVLTVDYRPEEPLHLWILSVGAQSNLHWTGKDAHDFGRLFDHQSGEHRLYKKVTTTILDSAKADVSGILKQLVRIKTRYEQAELTRQDMVILFFSAHGDDPNQTFYLQPTNYVRESPEKTGICLADIEKILKDVKCKKLLFLDACKSGTVKTDIDPARLTQARNEQIKALDGWSIFTSSNTELSYEDARWQNGSFTEAIVEALAQGKADSDKDGIVTIQELADFVARRVRQLNEAAGYPAQYPQFKNKLIPTLPLFVVPK